MAVAIAWLPGPAGTRRRVAKLSVEEPDAAEPARPDLWGARVSNDPGLPDRPAALRTDNGPEFLAQPFIDWCTDHRVAIHYIQPGKPDQNAYIERFNRSYRTEVLNAHLFESIAELQALTMTWLRIYNEERPHDSLGRVPPLTFLPRPKTARESTCKVST